MATETTQTPTPEQIEQMVKSDPQTYHFGACPECGAVGEMIHVSPKEEVMICRRCMVADKRVFHVCSAWDMTVGQFAANRELHTRCTDRKFILPTKADYDRLSKVQARDTVLTACTEDQKPFSILNHLPNPFEAVVMNRIAALMPNRRIWVMDQLGTYAKYYAALEMGVGIGTDEAMDLISSVKDLERMGIIQGAPDLEVFEAWLNSERQPGEDRITIREEWFAIADGEVEVQYEYDHKGIDNDL